VWPDLTEQDNDNRITRADLLKAMAQLGYDASAERADSILREVDFGRKGGIEFQDYLDVSAQCISFLPRASSNSYLVRCAKHPPIRHH
jgi:Ca2+-binding EF-hand superfamily protein